MSSAPLTREAVRPAPRSVADAELALREQLSNVRGLLALSLLMTERRDEDEILHLATTATPALVGCRVVGVHLNGRGWYDERSFPDRRSAERAARQLTDVSPGGGPVALPDHVWAWAFQLPGVEEPVGHLVVGGVVEPPATDLRLLRSLAQQTGIAVANARVHAGYRAANVALAETVALLERKNEIHDRFTQVAVNLDGYPGIVRALHELTGLTAVVEDDRGTVLAGAGPGGAPPAVTAAVRADLTRRAVRAGHPIHAEGRLLNVARPRADVTAWISLLGPAEAMGEQETMALEHAATVLSIELARLHSIAETELRLGVDLVADLISGADEGVHARARILGHDLALPHRVLVLRSRRQDVLQELLPSLRAVLSGPQGVLLMSQGNAVVAVVAVEQSASDQPWSRLSATLQQTAAGRGVRVGVGGACLSAVDYPRSYREAQLSLRLAEHSGRQEAMTYDDLGVFQFLSEATDTSGVDAFVQRWLGPLLEYDERRGGDLVLTLARFLDSGGSYDATARALGSGRSTIRYRIGRVAEITGHRLGDPDTRFQLQLATRAWLTLQALADQG